MAARVFSNLGGKGKVFESAQLHSANAERMNLTQALAHRSTTLASTVEDILTISPMWQMIDADDAVTYGDIIYAGSITPEVPWRRLAIGASGDILYTDGFSPCWMEGSLLGNFLPTATSRGSILRSNASLIWEEHFAASDGAAIYGDGLDVISSMTPTFKGTHTHTACIVMDKSSGCSPEIAFIGGSNNDTVLMYLDEDAGAGNSDLKIQMAGASGGNARVVFEQSDGTNVAGFHAAGQLSLEMDDFEIGRGEFETGVNDVKLVFDATPTPSQIKIEDGDFNINTASRGIIHVDGNTAGYILQADGTRYVPADPAGVLPVTPSGRGYILRSNATPAWEEHLANTDGAAIYGDGTDVLSSLTPTFKGVHTHTANIVLDDGTGDSPALQFVGGSNDDTASIFLDDDASVNTSDLAIQLTGTASGARLLIKDSVAANVLQIDANGRIYVVDDASIGLAGTGGQIFFDDSTSPDTIRVRYANLVMTTDAGADILTFKRSGDVTNTEADIYASAYGGFAADQGLGMFIDADNNSSSDYFAVLHNADDFANATELFRVDESGDVLTTGVYGWSADANTYIHRPAADQLDLYVGGVTFLHAVEAATDYLALLDGKNFIGDTANSDMGVGLTVNQGGNADEALACKGNGVGHGFTTLAETDTYFSVRQVEAASGGALLRGMKDSGGVNYAAMYLQGSLAENTDTDKTNSARAIVEVWGHQSSGDAYANTVANGNVFAVRTRRGGSFVSVVFADEDGDWYHDGSLQSFDDHDDALAVRDLAKGLAGMWEQVIEYNAPALERMGVISAPDEHGRRMMSTKRSKALMMGAIGQLYQRLQALEAKVG
jgi:hypothetical protein